LAITKNQSSQMSNLENNNWRRLFYSSKGFL
jgi:hypothetical protein